MTDEDTPVPDHLPDDQPKDSPNPQGRKRSPVIPGVIAALALVVAGGMYLISQQSDSDRPPAVLVTPAESATNEQDKEATGKALAATIIRRQAQDPLARGKLDAPVQMIMFSEFQCPFCGKFARESYPQLNRYVDDGTLRMEWHDFPYLGKDSVTIAVAARAAGAQGKFWAFHDAWFADQPAPNSGAVTPARLDQVATKAGLDVARFRTDRANPDLVTAVQADTDKAQRLGIGGTPAFLINGSVIMGAQPVDDFIALIDRHAREASGT